MKRGLVVCRTGMGSSMMLRIKLEQVIGENKFPLELEHDVLSAISNYDVDCVITMMDLVEQIKDEAKYVIGINDLMNKVEMKEKIEKSNTEIVKIEKEKKKLLEFLTKELISEDEYIEEKNIKQRQIFHQNENIKKYESLIQFELNKNTNNDNLEILRTVLKNIDESEKEEINSIMRIMIDEVVILDYKTEKVKIKLNI